MDLIIDSMARTFEVLAYIEWAEAWGEHAREHGGEKPDGCFEARGGEDWFDVAPVTNDPRYRDEAGRLFSRIRDEWCVSPAVVLNRHGYKDQEDHEAWGYCAVMSAVGHGVSWEDDHEFLTLAGRELHVHASAQVPEWSGPWPHIGGAS